MKNNDSAGKGLLRVFVAIDLPRTVKDEIRRIQKTLKETNLFTGTYVNPDDAHLTLQFIGYIDPVALAPIKKLLKTISFEPIQAQLGGVGAFGNHRFIKIVWLHVAGSGIMELAHEIEEKLSMGTVARKRPFQSHVTLVRIKRVDDVAALTQALSTTAVEPISFTIDEFVLKQSTLTSEGPIYVDLGHYEAG